MKTFLTAAAIAVLALLSPSGTFARDFDFDMTNPPATLSEGPLRLELGDSVRLVLDENPSTGYKWIYHDHVERGIAAEEAVYSVELDESRIHKALNYGAGQQAMPMPGSGSTRVIEIKAVQAGEDTFEAIYARSWEIAEGAPLHTNSNYGHHKLTFHVSEAEE